MASIFGDKLKVSIFGQSHSPAIGVVVDGLPAGFEIDMDKLQAFLERRAPGHSDLTTRRKEGDKPEFLSGLFNGMTCGAPLAAIIRNEDVRSQDYEEMAGAPRPGHADLTAHIKFGGAEDYRGGGHFSGRLTAPLCIAGGIALQMLEEEDILVEARIVELGGVDLRGFYDADSLSAAASDKDSSDEKNGALNREIARIIGEAKEEGDSVGGIVECRIKNVPPGLGDPIFDGMENRISRAVFGIPAIKGIEFGAGFEAARMKGSENNDAYLPVTGDGSEDGLLIFDEESEMMIPGTATNNAGGILGGITNGQDIVFRVAVKPTPSIAKEQDTVNYETGEARKLVVRGRHDPSIVPRVVPCVEATAAIVVLDCLL